MVDAAFAQMFAHRQSGLTAPDNQRIDDFRRHAVLSGGILDVAANPSGGATRPKLSIL
jgi:hypothetical protein